ncbi:Sodium-dependent serotonin transporter, partial [Cichlidogyrus casuarinus]
MVFRKNKKPASTVVTTQFSSPNAITDVIGAEYMSMLHNSDPPQYHTDNKATTIDNGNGKTCLLPIRETEIDTNNETQAANSGTIEVKRETWDTKLDFLLSVIGFAVDLGNIWRFPYICFENGGGAFLIPYLIMYIFGGLPLFYLELALGQFQRAGCITVWRRICPMFWGVGFGICIIGSYTAFYYNTIMAWALYYLYSSFTTTLPWGTCDNPWNSVNCSYALESSANSSRSANLGNRVSSTEEFFFFKLLNINFNMSTNSSSGLQDVGNIQWHISLCLLVIFIIVYFSMWKGVKSSGKAVWVTATVPYLILFILLVQGLTLEGSLEGIKYYLKPDFQALLKTSVWTAAASQIFFSLGPGFGVLLALSSYNNFHNNCYLDAMVTSFINCFTSFLSGFVVFSVLGYMCNKLNKSMEQVAASGPGLVFLVYPEAISTMKFAPFFAIIFMIMLITLGLDSTFAGLEAIMTAILDMWPKLRSRRELIVLALIVYCYLGALATTTSGGYFVLSLLDNFAAPYSIIVIVLCECLALSWFYGVDRFSDDIQMMLGFKPGIFWRICWKFISPLFLFFICLMNFYSLTMEGGEPVKVFSYVLPMDGWIKMIGLGILFSSIVFIPIFMLERFVKAKGSFRERVKQITTPLPRPSRSDHDLVAAGNKELEIKSSYNNKVEESGQ